MGAQSAQIRQIRAKMVEIMKQHASTCDLKELVNKFIPEVIGKEIQKSCDGIFPLQNVAIRRCTGTTPTRLSPLRSTGQRRRTTRPRRRRRPRSRVLCSYGKPSYIRPAQGSLGFVIRISPELHIKK